MFLLFIILLKTKLWYLCFVSHILEIIVLCLQLEVMEVKKKPEEEENELVSELKRQLENEHLTPVEKLRLLNDGLNSERLTSCQFLCQIYFQNKSMYNSFSLTFPVLDALNSAAVHVNSGELARLKSQLYLSGVLIHCIHVLSLHPSSLWGDLSAAATLAHLTR